MNKVGSRLSNEKTTNQNFYGHGKRGEVAEMPEIAEAEMPARNDCLLPSFSRKHAFTFTF